jgi:SAM-dependent methyltransferase
MVASLHGELARLTRRLAQVCVYRAPGERDDCPACASTRLFDLDVLPLRAGKTGLVCGCDACGLVFSNPLPTPRQLTEFYSPMGAWAADRRDLPEAPRELPGRAGGTWARMFDPIRGALDVTAPPPGASVLDFGCGEGKLLDQLQQCGWQTFGIEPATDRAFHRHRRLEAVPDRPVFDLIILIQVLEHVPNPLQLLRQLAGACRPGGHLLLSVPRFDTLPLHRDYGYVMNGRAHITAYTWGCMQTLLARSGWSPVAPPPAEIGKGGGGRRTTSRLRVVARRFDGETEGAPAPGAEARAALRAFYAARDERPWIARAGVIRLAARRADAERRRAKAARKAAKPGAAPETSEV